VLAQGRRARQRGQLLNFLFVSVLAPLLPTLARDFGFSTSGAGVLTAA
jgi:predicted MFS family arabinose efflux permease